jgi:hypothetical protein
MDPSAWATPVGLGAFLAGVGVLLAGLGIMLWGYREGHDREED